MKNNLSTIKCFSLFLFISIGTTVTSLSACGQSNCGSKKVKKYEYYNTVTNKVSGQYERIYLNDSVFYEIALYDDSNFKKNVVSDTFKIVNGNWYYKLENKFKVFFNIDSFLSKVPTIKKAYEFKGEFYGYGACTSYTPVEKINTNRETVFKFYVSDGDCKGGIPNRRDYNPVYYYFDTAIGFTSIKDRFDEYKMKVLEYY